MRKIGLQGRILGYFGPLVAGVVVGSLLIVNFHVTNLVRSAAREQLETSRRVFEELLATRADGLVTAATLVSELGVFDRALETGDTAALEAESRRLNQFIGSEVVVLTDRMGVILSRTDRRWEVGETFRETTSVAHALRGERASTMWAHDNRLYAMISVPIRLATGLAGTISVGYRVDSTFALELSLLSGHDVAFLVSSNIVASSRSLSDQEKQAIVHLLGKIDGSHPAYGDVDLSSGLPAIAVSPFFGIEANPVAAYAIIRSLEQDAAELRSLEHQTGLIAAGGLAAALAIAFFLSRSITRPLTELAAGARELAVGKYDFDLPPPTGSAEVEDLTRAFEAMRLSLRARIDDLERLTVQLEQRVQERTAALEQALRENRHLLEQLREWNDELERRVESRSRELAAVQQMLIRQDRMAAIGRLAAGVAHEINNPLGILAGFADGLLDRAKDPALSEAPAFADFPEYLRLIGQEVDRLKTIVQRFLHFAKSRAPQKRRIDVNDAAREVLDLLKNHSLREGKDLAGRLEAARLWTEADPEQLKQVVLNLALNGLDAVERGGWVRIETAAIGGTVEIRVCDNGAGIAPENRARVFEPFYSTKPPEKGTGLGLALCHDLIRENGGEIALAESEVGVGTVFVIRLPSEAQMRLRAHG